MAALSQFPPSLQVTTADDDMEISSQVGHYDHDIDIDLDLHSETGGDQDIDVQLEDARSEAGSMMQTHDLDMVQDHDNAMYDEQERENTAIDMMLGEQSQLVQEPVDPGFGDTTDPYDAVIAEATSRENDGTTDVLSGQLEFDELLEGNVLQNQAQAQEDFAVTFAREGESDEFTDRQGDNKHSPVDAVSGDKSSDRGSPSEAINTAENPNGLAPLDEITDLPQPHSSSSEGARVTQTGVPATNNSSYQAADTLEHPQQQDTQIAQGEESGEANDQEPEQPGTHSIIVSYDDARFSLFPPANDDESAEFLLQDSSLVSRSLVELFRACRDVLGEDVSEEEELKLVCRDLGLEISEESAHAFSTSLSEILEVFLELHRLDGVETPDPLEISLEKKERFTAGLSRLRAAVSDGRGMSSLWHDWNDDVEPQLGDDAQAVPAQEEKREEGEEATRNESTREDNALVEHAAVTAVAEAQAFDDNDPSSVAERDVSEETQDSGEGGTSRHAHDTQQSQVRPEDENGEGLYHHEQVLEEQGNDTQQIDVSEGVEIPSEEITHEEEDLIDYLEEEEEEEEVAGDEVKSSDSSTIIGDATAAADAEYGTVAPELHDDTDDRTDEHLEMPHHAYQDDEVQEVEDFGADNNYDEGFHDAEGSSNAFDAQGLKDHHVAADAAGGDITDDIDWADPTQPEATNDEPRVEEFGQTGPANEDDWEQLVEHDAVDDATASWPAHESTFDSNIDLLASSDALATAEGDQRGELGNVSELEPLDDRDEITFDAEGDEDGDGLGGDVGHGEQPSTTDLPDQSPLGKRSFTEHLHGDTHGEGSELEAKRLRST